MSNQHISNQNVDASTGLRVVPDNGMVEDVDPFDPARFRLPQDFTRAVVAKPTITEIPVGKPNNQEYVRVNSSPEFRMDAAIIEFEGKTHLVTPEAANGELRDHVKPATLFAAINTQGSVFLWKVGVPKDGRPNSWLDSARELANKSMKEAIQVRSNSAEHAKRYEGYTPKVTPPEPIWPDMSFKDMLKLAFGDRVISDTDHPVARRLLGDVFD